MKLQEAVELDGCWMVSLLRLNKHHPFFWDKETDLCDYIANKNTEYHNLSFYDVSGVKSNLLDGKRIRLVAQNAINKGETEIVVGWQVNNDQRNTFAW